MIENHSSSNQRRSHVLSIVSTRLIAIKDEAELLSGLLQVLHRVQVEESLVEPGALVVVVQTLRLRHKEHKERPLRAQLRSPR